MGRLLLMETTAEVCSVALGDGEELLCCVEHEEANAHSRVLLDLIDRALAELGWTSADLEGVALSAGPGSYTGLRIGSSTAKGLCFGLGIPLIAVDTLLATAFAMHQQHPEAKFLIPMLDARRMEVYAAVYDSALKSLLKPGPIVIVDNLFIPYLELGPVLFAGNGVEKCMEILHHKNAIFEIHLRPSARNMLNIAHKMFINNELEDIAYFEPRYLKAFWTPQSKQG